MSVRVRIAPSPTGDPHVGTAYIALFNYAFARKNGGQFVLRIEDTDQRRSRPESEEAIIRSLRWLGLEWNEGPDVGGPKGPYRQSERQPIYLEHAQALVSSGHAYVCDCTPERLEELREKRRAEKKNPGYDGNCRDRKLALENGKVVRLRTPDDGETIVRDRLRGEIRYPNQQVDDQVLLKSDGFPTYHLACVVDDHLMEITHVIRAEEWIPSTPKHVLLHKAFGWQETEWIHLPLLRNADKSKISKRKNPVSLDYYREIGIQPEAMRNFLGLLGFSIGEDQEKFTLDEMIQAFDVDRIQTSGPVFDLEKLTWLNGLYLRDLSARDIVERLKSWRLSDEFLQKVVTLLGERVRRLDEVIPMASYLLSGDLDYSASETPIVPKKREPRETAKMLESYADAIDQHRPFEAESLEQRSRAFCGEIGWKPKEVFGPVRTAVTAKKATPPLFDTMALVGREICRRRIRQAAQFLKTQPKS